jgi:Beta-propeller repeat
MTPAHKVRYAIATDVLLIDGRTHSQIIATDSGRGRNDPMKPSPQMVRRVVSIVGLAFLFTAFFPKGTIVSEPASQPHAASSDTVSKMSTKGASAAINSLPTNFEVNRGQADDDVKFIGRGKGFGVLLKSSEAVIALQNHKQTAQRVSMKLEGANSAAFVSGVGQQVARANYFIGNDPAKWVRDVETYSGVFYSSVYRGVDLMFHSNERELEYDFTVAPEGDPNTIRLRFDGADNARITSDGALILGTAAGELRHERPFAYQQSNGSMTPVQTVFKKRSDGTIGFQVGDYDRTLPLVIDPVLVYSTYLGGAASDFGRAITVDSAGNTYIAGDSVSSDFLFRASTSNSDVFVGRLGTNGLLFTYSFFGGAKNDTASGLIVDGSGNIYLSGTTESSDFPLVSSIGTALMGTSDAFVVKLTANFQQFFYSSLVGGTGRETGVSLAVDIAGSAYISGRTSSTDFPLAGAIQTSYGGGDSDAFVSKLALDGKTLVYSTYLGGSLAEDASGQSGISVDSAGNAYVTGDTLSANFPLRNPIQPSKNGGTSNSDAFVSVINASGSAFVYSTYLGGTNDDFGLAIATDASHNAYVAGKTKSTSFPGSTSTRTSTTTSDAFVAKISASGSAINYLTFVGGAVGDESANAIAVNATGDTVVIAGFAGAGVTAVKSIQSFFKGGAEDALIAMLGSNGAVAFSTYLGGSGDDDALGIALGSDGAIYVTGFTDSQDFLTFLELKDTNAGARDIFIAKIDPNTTLNRPVILQALISGKNLIIYGQGFDDGAVLLINDEATRTRNDDPDPSQILFAKKAAKRIAPGQTVQLQVENPNGKRSNFLFFTKPL